MIDNIKEISNPRKGNASLKKYNNSLQSIPFENQKNLSKKISKKFYDMMQITMNKKAKPGRDQF